MRRLVQEKELAIALRKKGFSYRDILKEIPVSKSSISLWLQNLPLTDEEKAYLKTRKEANISLGRIRAASALRQNRLKREELQFQEAQKEFELNKNDPFFHVGIALYWAEGGKRTNAFQFVNSDSDMLRLMVNWMERFLRLDRSRLKVRLYIHKPYAHENLEAWWAEQLNLSAPNFNRTIYKPTGLFIKKRPNYKGCLQVQSTLTNLRKMQFWQNLLLGYHLKQG